MSRAGHGMVLVSTQSDEPAQHFYRKLGYRDCGCLPLDCECYMFGKCWTGAYCRYFREAVLPLDPALEVALLAEGPRPDFKACPVCGRAVAPDGRQTYCSAACAKAAHRRQQREYMRKKRG